MCCRGLVVFKEVLKMLGFLLLIREGLSVPVSVVKYQVTGVCGIDKVTVRSVIVW